MISVHEIIRTFRNTNMDGTNNFTFQSQVEHQNKTHLLTLTKWQLIWEATSKVHASGSQILDPLISHDACIDLKEVIGVKPIKIPPKTGSVSLRKQFKAGENAPFLIEMQPLGPVGFSVYVVARHANHKWRCKQIAFQCKDSNLCQQWITVLKESLKAPELNRPQNLTVFVNPIGGKKKAVKIYKEKVLPLFELADIKATVIETERQNHARDLVRDSLDLSEVDGIVCVGGDGMFSEILNGLLNRTEHDQHLEETSTFEPVPPDIRIGIIPAGSTNTIVYTTTGVSDVVTSALHIVIGDSLSIDVNTVNVNDQFIRYSVTMLGYGYMGDLLKDSDSNRWMGPTRYNFSGTKKFLANNSYYGEIRFRLSSNNESHPADQVKCVAGCETCYKAKQDFDCSQSESDRSVSWDISAGGAGSVSSDTPESGEWRTVIGKFVAVNSVTMSCSCDLSPPGMSPYCHLGDGCMDLILVSDCSRLDFLKFLMRTAKGEERQDLGFIQMYRVREFTFRPLTEESDLEGLTKEAGLPESKKRKLLRQTSKTSVWNCDGEVIDHPKINVRVHCQLVKLFARGVEDLNVTEQRCKNCCNPVFS